MHLFEVEVGLFEQILNTNLIKTLLLCDFFHCMTSIGYNNPNCAQPGFVKFFFFFHFRSANDKPSIILQYPVLTILMIYLLFLLVMGIWKSRSFQIYYHRYFSSDTSDDGF